MSYVGSGEPEVMDPAIARLTAKSLQAVLLEKPSPLSPVHSNLRCSAAELLGRGFPLWERYVDIQQVGVAGGCGVTSVQGSDFTGPSILPIRDFLEW